MRDNLIKTNFNLPKNWEIEILENLTTKIVDGTHHTPTYTNYGIPFLRVTDVQSKQINLKKIKYVSAIEHNELIKRCYPQKGDLLLSKNGTIGISKIIDWDWEFSIFVSLALLKLKKNLDVKFLKFFLSSSLTKWQILKRAKQGTVTNLHLEEIRELEIPLLPLPQQKKIAKILSTCDLVIEKTEQAIAKYQAVKQGLMQDLFTRGIDPQTGKLRPSYKEAPQLYKNSALGFIPKDWEENNFNEISIKNLYGPRFSGNDYDKNGNVKTIRGMDFTKTGEILYKQAPTASLPNSKVKAHLLFENDIIIVTTADCGLTAVFEEQHFSFIPSAYSVKFRFKDNVNPYFIKFFMQIDFSLRQVNKYVRQGTLGNLPGSDILNFKVALPEIIEQNEIVYRLKSLDKKISKEQSSLAKYEQIKAGLMQDLLTGKVLVNC